MIDGLICVEKLYSYLFGTGKDLFQNILKMLLILLALFCAIFGENSE